MIALFKIAGLRRVEIAGLNVGDYDATRQTLTVRGKRNKTRSVPIEDASALGVLADWLHLKGEGKFATVVYAYSQG